MFKYIRWSLLLPFLGGCNSNDTVHPYHSVGMDFLYSEVEYAGRFPHPQHEAEYVQLGVNHDTVFTLNTLKMGTINGSEWTTETGAASMDSTRIVLHPNDSMISKVYFRIFDENGHEMLLRESDPTSSTLYTLERIRLSK